MNVRQPVWQSEQHPAPMTVRRLRERLASLPDDQVLQFEEFHSPEFSDWYREIRHLADVTDAGELILRTNADYILYEDEDEDNGEYGDTLPAGVTATDSDDHIVGPDGLRGWERDLLAS